MRYLRLIVLLIAVITVFSGATQIVAPAFVLEFVGGEVTPSTQHFFGIVGMFMVLFGGLVIHALYSARANPAALLWAAFQKLGAALAVFLAIHKDLFAPVAGLVAGFDLLSGILFLIYYRSVSRQYR